jgi:hypothetical protein
MLNLVYNTTNIYSINIIQENAQKRSNKYIVDQIIYFKIIDIFFVLTNNCMLFKFKIY